VPAFERRDLYQRAVVWPFTGYDAHGQPTVGPPQEIPVRWITRRREVMTSSGNIVALDAQAVVDQDIHIDSHMWLGTLGNWVGTGSAPANTEQELMIVKSFNKATDIKGRVTRRTVDLARFHQAGPD